MILIHVLQAVHEVPITTYPEVTPCWATLQNPILTHYTQCILSNVSMDMNNFAYTVIGLGLFYNQAKSTCVYSSFTLHNSSFANAYFYVDVNIDQRNLCLDSYFTIINAVNSELINITIEGQIKTQLPGLVQPVLLKNSTVNLVNFAKFSTNASDTQALELYYPTQTADKYRLINGLTFIPQVYMAKKFQFAISQDYFYAKSHALYCHQQYIIYNSAKIIFAGNDYTILRQKDETNQRFLDYNCSNCTCQQIVYDCNHSISDEQNCTNLNTRASEQKTRSEWRQALPCTPPRVMDVARQGCYDKCQPYTELFNGFCVTCSEHYYSDGGNDTCHENTCMNRLLLQNHTCVSQCSFGLYRFMDICVPNCIYNMVGCDTQCFYKCPIEMFNNSGVCVFSCMAFNKFSLKDQCVVECPQQIDTDMTHRECVLDMTITGMNYCYLKYGKKSNESLQFQQIYNSADCSQYIIMEQSYEKCQWPHMLQGNSCVLKCDDDFYQDIYKWQCVTRCSNITVFYDKQCGAVCPNGLFNHSGYCVGYCSKLSSFSEQQCYSEQCNIPLIRMIQECVYCNAQQGNVQVLGHGTQCVTQCQTQFTAHEGYCRSLQRCVNHLIQHEHCVPQCGYGYWYDSLLKMCIQQCPHLIDSRKLRCLEQCENPLAKEGNECVPECSSGLVMNQILKECSPTCAPQYLLNGSCSSSCNKQNTSLRLYQCVSECRLYEYYFDFHCYLQCPLLQTGLQLIPFRDRCAPIHELIIIPEDVAKLGEICNTSYYNTMELECTQNKSALPFRVMHNNITVLVDHCPVPYYVQGEECLLRCAQGFLKDQYTRMCTTMCPPFFYQQDDLCTKCLEQLFVTKTGQCVSECKEGVADSKLMRCGDQCSTPMFTDVDAHQCLTVCKRLTFQTWCVSLCPEYFYAQSMQCISKCSNSLKADPEARKCVSKCPERYFNQNGTCVQICDKFFDLEKRLCIDQCQGIIIGATRICVVGYKLNYSNQNDSSSDDMLIAYEKPRSKIHSSTWWAVFWITIWIVAMILAKN